MPALVIAVVFIILIWLENMIYMRYWRRGLSVSISLSDKTAFEGDELTLTEVLTNRKLLPIPYVAVKFQVSRNLVFTDRANSGVSDDYYRNDLFSVLMFQRITRQLPFICSKRGYYTIKSIDLVSSNILFTHKLVGHETCNAGITVYPRHVDIDDAVIPYKKMFGSVIAKRFINPDPFEFKGIRDYEPYDSFKSINFKASAKTGRLMVNTNDFTISQEICLILNLQRYNNWSSPYLFEQSIRFCATLASYYINEGIPLSFLSNGRDIGDGKPVSVGSGSGGSHLINVYESLARIDLEKPCDAIAPAIYDKAATSEREPIYILVSTYHEQPLRDAFAELQDSGAEALWIIPAFTDLPVTMPLSDQVVIWEVKPDVQK